MQKTIRTQQIVRDELFAKLERAEKFNYNLSQARIKAKQSSVIYNEEPTTENRLRMNWLNSEVANICEINIEEIQKEIETLIKSN